MLISPFPRVGKGPGIGAELLGRFLSPDPYVQSPNYSQSYNRYSYCLNNPLKYSDPSGYSAWKFEPADYIATFGGGCGAGIFRINWNQNLAVPGSYSYDWNTGTYRNSKGEEVTWDEVNGFIANESLTLTGVAAQSLYQNYTYGMNIYSISAFGRATLVSCFGELGPVEGSEEVGIYFNNPTAGAFIGEAEVFDNMITEGGEGREISAKDFWGITMGAAATIADLKSNGMHNSIYWVQKNGKVTLTKNIGNNYLLKRSFRIAEEALQNGKMIAKSLTQINIAYSVSDYALTWVTAGMPSFGQGMDLFFTALAAIPGAGWAVSGGYWIISAGSYAITGKWMSEHMDNWIY